MIIAKIGMRVKTKELLYEIIGFDDSILHNCKVAICKVLYRGPSGSYRVEDFFEMSPTHFSSFTSVRKQLFNQEKE